MKEFAIFQSNVNLTYVNSALALTSDHKVCHSRKNICIFQYCIFAAENEKIISGIKRSILDHGIFYFLEKKIINTQKIHLW